MTRLRAALAGLALAALAVAGPGAAARDQLTIGITQYPSNFHPLIDSMMAKAYVHAMTARRLTMYDQNWEIVCMLCTEVPTIENGRAVIEDLPPDVEGVGDGRGIAVTFTIREGATWGDGTPVTSADAKFAWEVGRHPQSGVSNSEAFRQIWKVDVVDDHTFTLHEDRVTFTYNVPDMELLPEHLERPIFEASPADYRLRTTYDTDPTNPGLAFGPYRITKVETGSYIVLERNPTWWGEPGAFSRIVVRTIENTAALEANLLSGSVDMVAGELGFEIDQALAFEKRNGSRFNILYKPGLSYEHIDLNLDNPILADIRVRKALIYAIDREAISQQLFEGRQPVADGQTSPLDWVYDPDKPQYVYDPEEAARLLDEAGWTERRRGIRTNAKGETLTLELMTTAGNRTRELVEQVLQDQWRQAGIDVRIRNEPARVYFGETLTKRKYTGMAMYAWLSSPESVPRTTLHSEMIPTEANNWSGQNYPGYKNPEMDRLIEAIEVELDRDKRKALWSKLQRLYVEDLPVIPLYFRAQAYILPKWLEGVTPTGHQRPSTHWVEKWRVVE
jgi:peptide/nickel transport system substrate-binding protein